MSERPVRVHVAPTGNAFMADIAAWLVEAAAGAGRTAELVDDGSLPVADGAVELVVAPHEFFPLSAHPPAELRRAASTSIQVCTEQPGTPWFNLAAEACRLAPAVLDINQHGVRALAARGIAAQWLRLGAVPSIDHRHEVGERDLDVVFLGGTTERRGARLAELGPLLWDRPAELRLFSPSRPVHPGVPGLVFGDDKYRLLARSRILVNVHRDDPSPARPAYFEWARMVEAMANGCVVVSEPSTGHDELVDGVHLVETDDLAGAVAALLDDPARLDELAAAAHAAVTGSLSLTDRVAELLPHLDRAAAEAEGRAASARSSPSGATSTGRSSRRRSWRRRDRATDLPTTHAPPLLPAFAPARALRLRTYHALMDEMLLQRRIDAARCLLRHGRPDHVERWTSPAYASAEPAVSVVVTLFNYAGVVTETLDSLAASTGIAFEVVVVDDHSTDDGRAVVRRWSDAHADVPLLVLGSDVNRGLATSRNEGIAAARADRIMIIDADNLVYPSCLARLSAALDADPDAAMAYAMLEDFGVRRGVRSAMGWYVPWLCDQNYIDAQAMVRRRTFERHGGYRTDDHLVHGWEDWELWLRLAEAGEHGVHVPVMLGRYRTQATSMITTSNLAADVMYARLQELHPSLPWPSGP